MLISGEAEIYGAFPQKKLYIPVRHLRVLFQKQGNGTGYVRGGHAGAAFYSIAAGLIAAACDGSAGATISGLQMQERVGRGPE